LDFFCDITDVHRIMFRGIAASIIIVETIPKPLLVFFYRDFLAFAGSVFSAPASSLSILDSKGH
jgi:hypothetical protein